MTATAAGPALDEGCWSRGDDGTVPAFDRVNARLAELDAEPRDPDPEIAELQDDRDRAAYLGDWLRAQTTAARVMDLRIAAQLDDRERE